MSSAVLVTGATGFIGSMVVRALRAQGREVIALGHADGDIADADTLARFHDAGIESVVHAAGRTFVPDSWDDPAGFLHTNAIGTARVLDFCRVTGARLTHISAYIYGRPETLPISEHAPIRANNPYAHSKHVAEQICHFHAESYGVPVTIIRPFNIYGPGQPEKFLIPTILSQVQRGGTITLLDLEPRRDYVFLPDVVDAILLAETRAPKGCETFNIGSGYSRSVRELVAEIQAVAGTALEVRDRGERRDNEIFDVVADISAARAFLGWNPRHSLAEGLKLCWQQYSHDEQNSLAGSRSAPVTRRTESHHP
jgi:nucleoside-diphosphate-sugar epimerase